MHSRWIAFLLHDLGHEIIVANPRKLRLIYKNDSKDDKIDAEYLARVARMDVKLLSPIQHRKDSVQHDLAIVRARDTLVQVRTKLINTMRGMLKTTGQRLPKITAAAFGRKVIELIPQELQPALKPLAEAVEDMSQRILAYDKLINRRAKTYPEVDALRQINGVGPITALAYITTIDDPFRFKKSRTVGSFLGLRPRRDESGESKPELRITKAGNTYLRRLLVGCAQYILGPFGKDCDIRRWGLAIAQGKVPSKDSNQAAVKRTVKPGKSARKRAVVGVARKLAVLLHRLWVTGQTYEPFRNSQPVVNDEAVAA